MRCIVAICCACCLLLSAAALRYPGGDALPSMGATLANALTAGTELMQQSDHQRRVERAKKAEAADRQIAAFGMPEAASRDYDYLAFVVLVASIVVLAFVARRKRRTRFRL